MKTIMLIGYVFLFTVTLLGYAHPPVSVTDKVTFWCICLMTIPITFLASLKRDF